MRKVIVLAAAGFALTLAACNLYFDDGGSSRGGVGNDPSVPDAGVWPAPDAAVFPDGAPCGGGHDGGDPVPDAGTYPYPDAAIVPDAGCCPH